MPTAAEFERELAHCRVFYWIDCDQLDDPHTKLRNKYGIVLNTVFPNEVIYYALSTTKLDRFNKFVIERDNGLFVPAGTYGFWKEHTFIPLLNLPIPIATASLRALFETAKLRFVGSLSEQHKAEIVDIVRESPGVKKESLRFITPWEA